MTGLSGSGPAYVFLVAEALIAAAVDVGLDPDLAATLTTQLLVGSAALLAERGDPAALRVMVTSPGGTTAAGLRVLDEREVRNAFARRSRRRPHAAASCRRTTDGRPHQRQMRIRAITPATRIRARSRAIVSVVAGRMAPTLPATGELDACRRRRGVVVPGGPELNGVTWSKGQFGGR